MQPSKNRDPKNLQDDPEESLKNTKRICCQFSDWLAQKLRHLEKIEDNLVEVSRNPPRICSFF